MNRVFFFWCCHQARPSAAGVVFLPRSCSSLGRHPCRTTKPWSTTRLRPWNLWVPGSIGQPQLDNGCVQNASLWPMSGPHCRFRDPRHCSYPCTSSYQSVTLPRGGFAACSMVATSIVATKCSPLGPICSVPVSRETNVLDTVSRRLQRDPSVISRALAKPMGSVRAGTQIRTGLGVLMLLLGARPGLHLYREYVPHSLHLPALGCECCIYSCLLTGVHAVQHLLAVPGLHCAAGRTRCIQRRLRVVRAN